MLSSATKLFRIFDRSHRDGMSEANLRWAVFEVRCPRFERRNSHAHRRQMVLRFRFQNYRGSTIGLVGIGSIKRPQGVSAFAARDLATDLMPEDIIAKVRAR
jgi:hypothetical protein